MKLLEKAKSLLWVNKKGYDLDIGDYSLFHDVFNSKDTINKLSRTDYLTLYRGWVYICVSTIAESIMKLDRKLYWSETRTDREKTHPYMKLVKNALIIQIVSYLELNGSFFILKEKIGSRIDSLKVLRPDLVTIKQDETGKILGYTFYNWKREIHFEKDEIIAFHNFNPMETFPNQTKWVWTVEAVAMQASMDNAIIKWNWNFFKNNWSHWTTFESDKTVDSKEQKRFLAMYKSEFAGVNNAFKTLFLDNGVKMNKWGINQREMDFVEQRRFTRDEILAIFRIPKIVLGIPEGSGYSDRKNAVESFAEFRLKPMATALQELFNDDIFSEAWYFAFENIIPVDKEQVREDFRDWIILKSEARSKLGYSFLDWTDVYIDWTTAQVDREAPKWLLGSWLSKAVEKAMKSVTKGTEEYYEKRWEYKIARTDNYESDMAKIMTRMFNTQENAIIKKIEWKKSAEDIENEDDLFSETAFLALYIGYFSGFFKDFINKEWKIAMGEVNSELVFNTNNTDKWIGQNLKRMWKDLDKTTKKKIFKTIKAWVKEWLSNENIIKNIKAEFRSFKTARIKNIVRSEVARGLTYSRLEAWGQAGINKKKWFTALDERVCPHCKSLHGKEIKLKDDFFKKWSTMDTGLKLDYENIQGSPLHWHCRCDIIAVDE